MTEALIGLAGILIGLLLNEHFRRSNRIENYSTKVFEKKLEIYEQLIILINEKSSVVIDTIENVDVLKELTKEVAREVCFTAGIELMEFCDTNQLYLNEEITIHIGATFVGTGEIIDADEEEKASQLQKFRSAVGETKKMIKTESGIEELDSFFTKITKAKHNSPAIEYFKKLKKNKV